MSSNYIPNKIFKGSRKRWQDISLLSQGVAVFTFGANQQRTERSSQIEVRFLDFTQPTVQEWAARAARVVWVILLRPRLYFCLPVSVGRGRLLFFCFLPPPGPQLCHFYVPSGMPPLMPPADYHLTSPQSCVTCLLKSPEKQGFLVEHFAALKK